MDDHGRRRRDVNPWIERRENPPPIWRHACAKRQWQLRDFLHKKSLKKQKSVSTSETYDSEGEMINSPDDLLFIIFSLLPAESLLKMQFVCKEWFALINYPVFIKIHKQLSETVLISQDMVIDDADSPSGHFLTSLEKPKHNPHFHYLDLRYGNDNFVESNIIDLVKIRASCNGLVLGVRARNKGLILLNPLTRKHKDLPLGTIGFKDCYGFGLCIKAKAYKVAHLFREASGYTSCEIFNVSTRKWSVINGPPSELLGDIRQKPVSVGGSLYWMPRQHGCDYFVSLNLEDEDFQTKNLPIFCAVNDRLVDMDGDLGFVTHVTLNLMQVWILDKCGNWMKRYSIYLAFDVTRVIPICSSGNGREIVFEYPGHCLYVYNVEDGGMKEVYSRDDEEYSEGAEILFIPHRNTLASWEDMVD